MQNSGVLTSPRCLLLSLAGEELSGQRSTRPRRSVGNLAELWPCFNPLLSGAMALALRSRSARHFPRRQAGFQPPRSPATSPQGFARSVFARLSRNPARSKAPPPHVVRVPVGSIRANRERPGIAPVSCHGKYDIFRSSSTNFVDLECIDEYTLGHRYSLTDRCNTSSSPQPHEACPSDRSCG